MEITVEEDGTITTIHISGEITALSCGELRDTLLSSAEKSPEVIRLDLRSVPFIDSSGLGVLVGVRGHLRKYNTRMELINSQPSVVKVFQLTRLSKIFGLPE